MTQGPTCTTRVHDLLPAPIELRIEALLVAGDARGKHGASLIRYVTRHLQSDIAEKAVAMREAQRIS